MTTKIAGVEIQSQIILLRLPSNYFNLVSLYSVSLLRAFFAACQKVPSLHVRNHQPFLLPFLLAHLQTTSRPTSIAELWNIFATSVRWPLQRRIRCVTITVINQASTFSTKAPIFFCSEKYVNGPRNWKRPSLFVTFHPGWSSCDRERNLAQ